MNGAEPMLSGTVGGALLADIVPVLLVYIVWFYCTIFTYPLFRLARLSVIQSWLAARVLGPSLVSLVALHFCRWGRLSVLPAAGAALAVFGVVAGAVCWRSLISRRLRIIGSRRAVKFLLRAEVCVFATSVLLTVLFGFYYGPHWRGERPWDLGLVNCLMSCSDLPPEHFWAAGLPLHYYYFGSFVAAVQGALGYVAGHYAYFAQLVFVWVQTGLAFWLCARRLGARGIAAWLAPFCVLALGSGGAIYQWLVNGISPLTDAALVKSVRVIPFTIHEPPPSAFWGSELHSYVMGLPFMAMLVYLLLQSLFRRSWGGINLLGVTAAALLMTDAWQAPGMAVAGLFLVIWMAWQSRVDLRFIMFAIPASVVVALVFASALLIGFHGQPVHFRLVQHTTTRLPHVLAIWGVIVLVLLLARSSRGRAYPRVRMALPLIVAAVVMIGICEITYLDMGLPEPGERQNTVMRFYWTAYVLLSLAAPAVLTKLGVGRNLLTRVSRVALVALLVIFGLVNVLPAIGQMRKVPDLWHWTTDVRVGLDPADSGLIRVADYMQSHYMDSTFAESGGNPYRGFSYVSAMTGQPTVLGEVDKLNNCGIPVAESVARFNDLSALYANSPNADGIVRKYSIRYVVLGPAEQQAYAGTDVQGLLSRYKITAKFGRVYLLDVGSAYRGGAARGEEQTPAGGTVNREP